MHEKRNAQRGEKEVEKGWLWNTQEERHGGESTKINREKKGGRHKRASSQML